jgi:nucleoid-associated protein YgaU
VTEPETSATGADDELWLTYLNYDRAVQQAVNRLGALSSNNVDEFRALLLKGRDRARVKEYEAESIRRLQGEAFVGDDELQRALIVLNAEDERMGAELKRIVSATGRPADLDQTVSAIRLGQVIQPIQTSSQSVPPREQQSAAPAPEPVSPIADQTKIEPPARRQRVEPTPASFQRREPQQIQRPVWTKRLAIFGAIFIVAAVGVVIVSSRLATDDAAKISSVQVTTPPLRAAAEDRRAASAVANQVVQRAPAEALAQSDNPPSGQMASSAEPASPEKETSPSSDVSVPVPGSRYKVVRGDMLTEIALRAYKDASKYTLIQKANPGLRNGPNRIYYDQMIYIPPMP